MYITGGLHRVSWWLSCTALSTKKWVGSLCLRQTSNYALDYSRLFSQVQSEILKTWKRWKLGRNIEEEYRHTYSNTHNTKTGSLLNHVSQLPQLPNVAKTSPPICNPEETRMLVAGCYNGMPHGREEERGLPTPCEGNNSRCALVDDISLCKVQCCEGQRENVESHMWDVRTQCRKLLSLELLPSADVLPHVAVRGWTQSSVGEVCHQISVRRRLSSPLYSLRSAGSQAWCAWSWCSSHTEGCINIFTQICYVKCGYSKNLKYGLWKQTKKCIFF